MRVERSKNHHYVPQVLQRRFMGNQTRLWYSKKTVDDLFCQPECRNPKSIFKKRNYYSTLAKNDQLSDDIERGFYGPLDDYVAKLLFEISQTFSNGSIPTFRGEALETVRLAMFEMLKRTPDFPKDHDDFEVGRNLVAGILSDPKETLEELDRKELERQLEDQNLLTSIGRDIRVRATLRVSEKISDALENFQVRWYRCKPRYPLILSSSMVYRIGNGGVNGLVNPQFEMWMPVSPTHALVLARDPDNKIPLVVDGSRGHVREINLHAAQISREIASPSKSAISEVVRRHNSEVGTKRISL